MIIENMTLLEKYQKFLVNNTRPEFQPKSVIIFGHQNMKTAGEKYFRFLK